MAKFIKLTDQERKPVYVATEAISFFEPFDGSSTETKACLQLRDEVAIYVLEAPEQILALIEAASPPTPNKGETT